MERCDTQDDGPLLHCFPHGGGTAEAFRRWPALFSPARVVVGPGECGASSVREIVQRWRSITPDRSGVYYGHSLGSLVAFEAAASALLDGRPDQTPTALVLGAPPDPGAEMAQRLGSIGSHDTAIADLVAILRRYHPSTPRLPLQVLVLHGDVDVIVRADEAAGWVARGGPGSQLLRLEGAGHMFHLAPMSAWVTPIRGLLDRRVHA